MWNYRDSTVPYMSHFHMGYGICHCDSMKNDLMPHWITMEYAVSRMKMPHVRDSAICKLYVSTWMIRIWAVLKSDDKSLFPRLEICLEINNNRNSRKRVFLILVPKISIFVKNFNTKFMQDFETSYGYFTIVTKTQISLLKQVPLKMWIILFWFAFMNMPLSLE